MFLYSGDYGSKLTKTGLNQRTGLEPRKLALSRPGQARAEPLQLSLWQITKIATWAPISPQGETKRMRRLFSAFKVLVLYEGARGLTFLCCSNSMCAASLSTPTKDHWRQWHDKWVVWVFLCYQGGSTKLQTTRYHNGVGREGVARETFHTIYGRSTRLHSR